MSERTNDGRGGGKRLLLAARLPSLWAEEESLAGAPMGILAPAKKEEEGFALTLRLSRGLGNKLKGRLIKVK